MRSQSQVLLGVCAMGLAFGGIAGCTQPQNSNPAFASDEHRSAGRITLTAAAAKMIGSDAKLERTATEEHVGWWERERTSLVWTAHNVKPGTYTVEALYSLDPQYSGSTIAMTVGSQTLSKKLEPTLNWNDYHSLHLGEVHIDKAGDTTLTMKVTDKPKLFVMNLQNVTLTPH